VPLLLLGDDDQPDPDPGARPEARRSRAGGT
jgi:hypothetical protein